MRKVVVARGGSTSATKPKTKELKYSQDAQAIDVDVEADVASIPVFPNEDPFSGELLTEVQPFSDSLAATIPEETEDMATLEGLMALMRETNATSHATNKVVTKMECDFGERFTKVETKFGEVDKQLAVQKQFNDRMEQELKRLRVASSSASTTVSSRGSDVAPPLISRPSSVPFAPQFVTVRGWIDHDSSMEQQRAARIGGNRASELINTTSAMLGDLATTIDLEGSIAKLDGKVSHTFCNLFFKKDVTVAQRYEIERKLKIQLAGSEDCRHLSAKIHVKPEDQPRRVAMGKFFSWMRKNTLSTDNLKSQWLKDSIEVHHQPVKGEVGTLLGTWYGEVTGWEISIDTWRRLFGDKIPEAWDSSTIAKGVRGN